MTSQRKVEILAAALRRWPCNYCWESGVAKVDPSATASSTDMPMCGHCGGSHICAVAVAALREAGFSLGDTVVIPEN